jgi:hypothetical protein
MELDEEHRERVFESVVSDLVHGSQGDAESMRRAAHSTKWLEGERRLLEPLLLLLENQSPDVRTSAAECLGHLRLAECLESLKSGIEKSFREETSTGEPFRQEAIRAIGNCGRDEAIPYLEAVMYEKIHEGLWSEDERSLAVESLTDFALAGSLPALEVLARGLGAGERLVKELSRFAMLEISERKFWHGKGYHSIIARFEVSKKDEGERDG